MNNNNIPLNNSQLYLQKLNHAEISTMSLYLRFSPIFIYVSVMIVGNRFLVMLALHIINV